MDGASTFRRFALKGLLAFRQREAVSTVVEAFSFFDNRLRSPAQAAFLRFDRFLRGLRTTR